MVMPLLIASFAFNFNNFNLVYIFNYGNPPMADTSIPIGHTDILISFVVQARVRVVQRVELRVRRGDRRRPVRRHRVDDLVPDPRHTGVGRGMSTPTVAA